MSATDEVRFSARILEKIDNGKGYWAFARIGIFDGEAQVGEYRRNYPSYGVDTFCPFEQDGRWYALYSKDYMYTRLMELPSCADLGGEGGGATASSGHFCPTGYYVPELTVQDFRPGEVDPQPYNPRHDPQRWQAKGLAGFAAWDADPEYQAAVRVSDAEHKAWYARHPFVTRHARWGFVSGCAWGDDSSWKIEFLDLARASEGIIVREARFGYIALPHGLNLRQAIDADRIGRDHNDPAKAHLTIALPTRFRLDGTWDPDYDEQQRLEGYVNPTREPAGDQNEGHVANPTP